MLRRLAADYQAQARAVVFDAKGRTFRDDQYPEYKAHRAPMPDDLSAQVEPLSEAIPRSAGRCSPSKASKPMTSIATLADEAARRGWRAVISTGDKDLAQLVDGCVTLVNTMSNETLDIEGVKLNLACRPRDRRLPDAGRRRDRQHSRVDKVGRRRCEMGSNSTARSTGDRAWRRDHRERRREPEERCSTGAEGPRVDHGEARRGPSRDALISLRWPSRPVRASAPSTSARVKTWLREGKARRSSRRRPPAIHPAEAQVTRQF